MEFSIFQNKFQFEANNISFLFQALQSFSAALASCQLGPLMAQFGLSDEAVQAANSGGCRSHIYFLKFFKSILCNVCHSSLG